MTPAGTVKRALARLCAAAVLFLAVVPVTLISSSKAVHAAACTPANGLKPLIRGLVDASSVPPAANVQAAAIEVKWSDLEPLGPGLIQGNKIDTTLAAAGCGTPLRLRIWAGVAAPEWVKQQSGGDVNVIDTFDHKVGTVGHFWTDSFKTAYDNLQAELAAAYDSVPNVAEVVVSRCTLFYPEPFIRDASIKSNVTNLLAAGYTVAADQQCQLEEIDSVVNHWTLTRAGVAFNPYEVVSAGITPRIDEAFTEQVMAYCRYTAGPRCVLENDSIRDPITRLVGPYSRMFSAMSGAAGTVELAVGGLDVDVKLGAPLAFKTAVRGRVGDFWGALIWARQHHAASVELPPDGTYPTSGGSSAPAWQSLAEVSQWFQEVPAITAGPLSAVEGQATAGMVVTNLNLDELAAVDTMGGYGDVGAVPFDTVSALVSWPDGTAEPALLTTGAGAPAGSVGCPAQRWCGVVIESGGHALTQEAPISSTTISVSLTQGAGSYVPAGGDQPTAVPALSVSDAALSVTSATVQGTLTALKVRLSTTFADADPWGRRTDYTVTIDWGDGSSSAIGAMVAGGGFSSSTTHVYAAAGTYTVGVTVLDAGGATAVASQPVTIG